MIKRWHILLLYDTKMKYLTVNLLYKDETSAVFVLLLPTILVTILTFFILFKITECWKIKTVYKKSKSVYFSTLWKF